MEFQYQILNNKLEKLVSQKTTNGSNLLETMFLLGLSKILFDRENFTIFSKISVPDPGQHSFR
jgi:hypothetical protein